METADLARLQFALTAGGHFLFVALTLGLATVVAALQTRATVTGNPVHLRMTRFWGQLYVINYAMGIVTGLVMEFQLGLTWSGLTHFAGNVFGGALAMETLLAFFVESTFLGLWIFGWGRLNRWAHLAAIWIVALTAYVSAYFIMVANGLLQHPVGATVVDGEMLLTDPAAVLANPTALLAFGHIVFAALVTGGFFLAGVSAYHLRRRTADQEFFRRSLRTGVALTLPGLLLTIGFGGLQFRWLQPSKMAAFGGDLEGMAAIQAEMTAAHGPGDYVPPTGLVQAGGQIMLGLGAVMLLVSLLSFVLMFFPAAIRRFRAWHVLLIAVIPLPFVATLGGWVFREVGRQPWIVYGELTTADALSDVSAAEVRLSLIGFVALFALIVTVNTWMLARHVRQGPESVALGRTIAAPEQVPAVTL